MTGLDSDFLVVDGLHKTLGRGSETFILNTGKITFPRGKITAIVGKSGSGKSTLLDMMCLISKPDHSKTFQMTARGEAPAPLQSLWDSEDDTKLAEIRRKHIGYVLQFGGLIPYMSVEENIALPRRLNNQPIDLQGIRERLRQFGLAQIASKSVRGLSGGERQRVAILRAFNHQPDMVFADEPTAALDYTNAQKILAAFSQIARDNATAVGIVTHDTDLILPFADQVVTLEKVEGSGTEAARYTTKVRTLQQDATRG